MTAVIVPERELNYRRAKKRIGEFNDTIDHFVAFSQDALHMANEAEAAKCRFIDSLTPEMRRDCGYE